MWASPPTARCSMLKLMTLPWGEWLTIIQPCYHKGERGLILKKGTIVDSTILSAASSTKSKEKNRDPDAHQVKRGNTWHYGYKAHIGMDKDSGLAHTVEATPENVHDVTEVQSC